MKRTTPLLWLLAFGLSASAAVAQDQEREQEERNYTTRVVKIKKLGRGDCIQAKIGYVGALGDELEGTLAVSPYYLDIGTLSKADLG